MFEPVMVKLRVAPWPRFVLLLVAFHGPSASESDVSARLLAVGFVVTVIVVFTKAPPGFVIVTVRSGLNGAELGSFDGTWTVVVRWVPSAVTRTLSAVTPLTVGSPGEAKVTVAPSLNF